MGGLIFSGQDFGGHGGPRPHQNSARCKWVFVDIFRFDWPPECEEEHIVSEVGR